MFLRLSQCLLNTSRINKIVFKPGAYDVYIQKPILGGAIIAASGYIPIQGDYIVTVDKTKSPEDYKSIEKFTQSF